MKDDEGNWKEVWALAGVGKKAALTFNDAGYRYAYNILVSFCTGALLCWF